MTGHSANSTTPTSHHAPRWLIVSAGALFLSVAIAYSFFVIFSRLPGVDEGYLMITIRGFIEGNPLYDSVFTQYGPFFYLWQWLMRAVLHIPLTHDATRLLCMFHWIAASAVLGLVGAKITKSLLGGLFVFAQSVVHLHYVANEPGHPQELVALLLALGALAALREGVKVGPWEAVALVTAALAFTKINVGVFFGFALFLAMRCQAAGRFSRVSNRLLLAFCVAIPFLLMRRHINVPWGRNYSILVACTLAAAFIVTWNFSEKTKVGLSKYFKVALFFIVPSILFLAVAVLTGSSARGLIDGLLLTPMKMPTMAVMALPLRNIVLLSAGAALITALLVTWKRANARTPLVVSVLKLGYGLAGILLVGETTVQFAFLLPWVWLAAVPNGRGEDRNGMNPFPRIFLCLAAALQSLQAYPVAGTQITIGSLLLVLSYATCVVDAIGGLRWCERFQRAVTRLSPGVVRMGLPLGLVALLGLFANVWCALPGVRHFYLSLPTLDLPGSRLVRFPRHSKEFFEELAHYLENESDTFITYPCVNSLYFWTSKRPPTQMNGTGWLQFSHAQQEQILSSVEKFPRAKIAIEIDMTSRQNVGGQLSPLWRYISDRCTEVKRIGPFRIFVLKPPERGFPTRSSVASF